MDLTDLVSTVVGGQRNLSWLWRLAGEPLLHFLLLGGGLFALFLAVSEQPLPSDPRRIVIDEVQIERLTVSFQRTWMRPPTQREVEGLIADYVKEEILYREALALGLDRDDLIIRRRMRQKMEFLNADLTAPPEPSDETLKAYLNDNVERFGDPDRFSFQQLYFKDGSSTEQRAARILAKLTTEPGSEEHIKTLGDSTLLPGSMDGATGNEIAATFGRELADVLPAAPVAEWSGPYRSTFGLHLVKITAQKPAETPKLADKRAAVLRDWEADQRDAADSRLYQALLERYAVDVRYPKPAEQRTGDQQVAAR